MRLRTLEKVPEFGSLREEGALTFFGLQINAELLILKIRIIKLDFTIG